MKRILATLFICILVLAGCGSNSSGGTGGSKPAKNIDDALAKLEGRTIKVATSNMGADNPFSDQAEENHDEGQDSDTRKQFLTDAQEKYGFTLEFVELDPAAQIEDVTASVLAGDPIGDVVRLNSGNYEALVATGMLEDISNVSSMVEDLNILSPWSFEIGNVLDGTYAIGRDRDARPEMLAFDLDLLKKAGMEETPFDLWMRDEWTWDNARQYFLDVQAGLGDEIQVWGDYPTYIRMYGIASGGTVAVQTDGTINYDDPAVYEAMDYYKGLYDDGLLTFYFDADGNRDYAQAEEAWRSGNTVFFSLQRWKNGGMANEGKNFGLVPYPIKDGLKKEDVFWPAPAGDVYVVPKGVEDVDSAALVAILMSAYGMYGSIYQTGEELPTIEENLTTSALQFLPIEGNEQTMIYMSENCKYDPIGMFISYTDDGFSPTNAVTDYIVNGTSLTSAFEEGQKELQANVETVKAKQAEEADELASESE